jgi:hypothetical protein
MLRPPAPILAFLNRRMRAVLPSYWLGSLLVLVVIVGLALVRSAIWGGDVAGLVRHGALLARAPYTVEPFDILRSLSVFGRFHDLRTMQVVAPSMWYVLLVLQAYCLFPFLRQLLTRMGPVWFLVAIGGTTILGRWLVERAGGVGTFTAHEAVVYLVPFRLGAVAVGMVASRWAVRFTAVPGRLASALLAAPALLIVIATVWASDEVNWPETTIGVIGPLVALLPALPAFWALASAATAVPMLCRLFTWAGKYSISILVAQDALRFIVGTVLLLGGKLAPWFWWLALPYLGATMLLAWAWAPVPAWVADKLWPPHD